MSKYYDRETKVSFIANQGLHTGIAYKNIIICFCCGSVFKISEVTDIEKLSWIS